MKTATPLPTAAELHRLFLYDADTGILRWRIKPAKCILAGSVAGHVHGSRGYIMVQLGRGHYLAHRIIWKMVTGKDPERFIDHANGVFGDNRFLNLREADDTQNRANTRRPVTNHSGFKGVSFKARGWEATIGFGYKKIYLGRFSDPQKAHAAYCTAAERYFGKFSRAT